jgi:hypothetical protein
MPLTISHPRHITQTIKVRLHEEWNILDEDAKIESDAFTYRRSKRYADKIITLRYHYDTKAPFIEAARVADHIEKIDQVNEDIGLNIYKPHGTEKIRSAYSYLVVFILIAVIVLVVRKRFTR